MFLVFILLDNRKELFANEKKSALGIFRGNIKWRKTTGKEGEERRSINNKKKSYIYSVLVFTMKIALFQI